MTRERRGAERGAARRDDPAILAGCRKDCPRQVQDALQRRDYPAPRCLSGVARITKRSRQSKIVLIRLAAHASPQRHLHWARTPVQHDPRVGQVCCIGAQGHGHRRALRSVTALAIAWAMLESRNLFNPCHHPAKITALNGSLESVSFPTRAILFAKATMIGIRDFRASIRASKDPAGGRRLDARRNKALAPIRKPRARCSIGITPNGF